MWRPEVKYKSQQTPWMNEKGLVCEELALVRFKKHGIALAHVGGTVVRSFTIFSTVFG